MPSTTAEKLARLVAFPTESRTPNRALIDWVAERCEAAGGRVNIIDGAGQCHDTAGRSIAAEAEGGTASRGDAVPPGSDFSTRDVPTLEPSRVKSRHDNGSSATGTTTAADPTTAAGRGAAIPGPDRVNLLASFGPDRPGGLMLSGHTDVVPAGTGWATDPYRLTRADHRWHGRGAADMKGFIASTLTIIERVGVTTLAAPLHLALSFDEEIGCIGVRGLLAAVESLGEVRPDLVVVGEPSMMRPRHRHLGKVGYEMTFGSTAAHSSLSYRIPSAIAAAGRFIAALDDIGRAAALDAAGNEPEVTVNCGTVNGGAGMNVIAEWCQLMFELRHTAGRDPDAALGPLWTMAGAIHDELSHHGSGVAALETVRYPALATLADQPMVQLVEQVAAAGECTPLGFGTEGGLFAAALDIPVVICGPGDIAVAHRADEYVTIDQLDRCDRFLTDLVRSACGTPAPGYLV